MDFLRDLWEGGTVGCIVDPSEIGVILVGPCKFVAASTNGVDID